MRHLALILGLLPCLAAARPDATRLTVAARDEAGAPVQAALRGGHLDPAGVLRGARVTLTWPDGRVWDAFAPGLHPWTLAAGTFAGGPVLLVGVRKPAPFDPLERERPFIYTIRPAGQGLRKRWLGTSLARPFRAVCFADLQPGGDDELCALERTRRGAWEIAAYIWEGFGVEGLACSPELPASGSLPESVPLAAPEGGRLMVMSRRGEQATFTAFALRPGEGPHTAALTPIARRVVTVGTRPFAWSPHTGRGIPLGITLSRGAVCRSLPLFPLP